MAGAIMKNATLFPLFLAVGLGLGGGIGFGVHYLKNSPDVVLRKRANPAPWNAVAQGTNTKLLSFNPDFWSARAQIADPRLGLLEPAAAEAARGAHAKASAKPNALHSA